MKAFDFRSPPSPRPVRAAAPLVLCAAAALQLAACNDIPKRQGSSVETVSPARLDTTLPTEVVVAPILNPSKDGKLPAAQLRDSFQQALVKRHYTPLAIEYVDAKVVEAAYRPGTLQEEAVLEITVERWDTSLWDDRGSVAVKLQARLLDARKPGGADIWSARLDRRFDLPTPEGTTGSPARLKAACDAIANEMLGALPQRPVQPRLSSR